MTLPGGFLRMAPRRSGKCESPMILPSRASVPTQATMSMRSFSIFTQYSEYGPTCQEACRLEVDWGWCWIGCAGECYLEAGEVDAIAGSGVSEVCCAVEFEDGLAGPQSYGTPLVSDSAENRVESVAASCFFTTRDADHHCLLECCHGCSERRVPWIRVQAREDANAKVGDADVDARWFEVVRKKRRAGRLCVFPNVVDDLAYGTRDRFG